MGRVLDKLQKEQIRNSYVICLRKLRSRFCFNIALGNCDMQNFYTESIPRIFPYFSNIFSSSSLVTLSNGKFPIKTLAFMSSKS